MFAVVDLETTGSVLKDDRIIEIAIIIHDGFNVIETFQSLVNPQRDIPPFIQKLTNISEDMVDVAPVFAMLAPLVFEMLRDKTLVAHGASFDYGFLRMEFLEEDMVYDVPVLDTHKLSRKYIPGLESYKIKSLVASLGLEVGELHRAFADAQVCAKVFEMVYPQWIAGDEGVDIDVII